jgi:hypothetical protein
LVAFVAAPRYLSVDATNIAATEVSVRLKARRHCDALYVVIDLIGRGRHFKRCGTSLVNEGDLRTDRLFAKKFFIAY